MGSMGGTRATPFSPNARLLFRSKTKTSGMDVHQTRARGFKPRKIDDAKMAPHAAEMASTKSHDGLLKVSL